MLNCTCSFVLRVGTSRVCISPMGPATVCRVNYPRVKQTPPFWHARWMDELLSTCHALLINIQLSPSRKLLPSLSLPLHLSTRQRWRCATGGKSFNIYRPSCSTPLAPSRSPIYIYTHTYTHIYARSQTHTGSKPGSQCRISSSDNPVQIRIRDSAHDASRKILKYDTTITLISGG